MGPGRVRSFRSQRRISRGLRAPGWAKALVGSSVAAGAGLGLLSRAGSRALRATLYGAGLGYLTVSLLDFAEHYRMERLVAGRYLAARAVPLGETANHVASTAMVVGMLARAGRGPIASAILPAAYLALGWRDEIVYHRRRATHREDILHTVAHLAAGVMLTALYATRLSARS